MRTLDNAGSGKIEIGDMIEIKVNELHGAFVREMWHAAIVLEVEPTLRVRMRSTGELRAIPPESYGTHWR